ncbi:MAG: glycosyltransferase family 4 protein [Candidatus Gygaella obscura]|nr:glycosyltransferase family 4 protein [Candidatus Gygaella obscura]
MNVLLVTKHLNIGGISRYVVNLAKGLKQNNINVFVASGTGVLKSELDKHKINHYKIDFNTKNEFNPFLFRQYLQLRKIVKDNDIDIVHAQERVTQVLCGLIAKYNDIKVISTCHGIYRVRFLRKIFPFFGDRVIAVSDYCRRLILDNFKIKEKKVKLINNGIDLSRFNQLDSLEKEALRNKYGLEKTDLVIGNIARFSPDKGLDLLLEVFKRVHDFLPQAKLVIVGGGPQEESLRFKAKALGITNDVRFLGFVNETKEPLSVMDVFCTTTKYESFGLSVLEAMAVGVTVVVSCVGGLKELVQDSVNGYCVEYDKLDCFTDRLIELLSNNSLRLGMAAQAQKFCFENFNIDNCVKKTIEVYKQVLI